MTNEKCRNVIVINSFCLRLKFIRFIVIITPHNDDILKMEFLIQFFSTSFLQQYISCVTTFFTKSKPLSFCANIIGSSGWKRLLLKQITTFFSNFNVNMSCQHYAGISSSITRLPGTHPQKPLIK